ncbi:MAG: nucleoside deaminase [Fibrobacterota bacterium]
MTESVTDLEFMGMAMELAREAALHGEVPIGAVVARSGQILSKSRNRMEELQDASAHAEILAIRGASAALDSWRLDDCTLYATLEPCPMCAGAILNSRIGRVVYAARDHRLGACHTHWALLTQNPIGREIDLLEGPLAHESAALLKSFFRELRNGSRESSKLRRGVGGAPEIV